jgi:hypothetical protein
VLELDSGIDLLPATVCYRSTQPGVAATRGIILMKMLMLQMMWANTIMIYNAVPLIIVITLFALSCKTIDPNTQPLFYH